MEQKRFNASLSKDTVQELKTRAIKEQVSASQLIERALEYYYQNIDDNKDPKKTERG